MLILLEDQVNALKYLIFKSKDASPEAKKVCFALIDASKRFRKPVYYTNDSRDIQMGVDNMISSGCNTHLTEILKAIGLKFIFSHHRGFFISEGNFRTKNRKGEEYTNTIWLSNVRYDYSAVEITKEDVEKIELKDPLYLE